MRHYDPGQSSEWYTPKRYIEAARCAMGGIDLDPASCARANQVVRANTYFDREADGLQRQWWGRVWLNPPYSDHRGQAATWAAKLLAEFQAGRVQQAVMLVNLSTAYQPAMQRVAAAGMVCMVDHRIAFEGGETGEREKPCRQRQRAPTQANMFFYLGRERQAFAEYFGDLGVVLGPALALVER